MDGAPKDSVALNETSQVEISNIDKKEFAFRITTKNPVEELYLNCDSEAERDDWIAAIKNVINPKSQDNSNKTDQEIELEDEMNRLRIIREKEVAEAEVNALKQQEILTLRKDREAAELLKKKAHQEAENRRLEEERQYKELLAKNEEERLLKEKQLKAEADSKAALIKIVTTPQPCNKKLSNENTYQKRHIFIDINAKEFHWGKTEDECTFKKSKAVHINIIKNIESNSSLNIPNFSIYFKENAELPDHVWTKSVFNSTAPTSIDVTAHEIEIVNAFIQVLKMLQEE